MEPGPPPDSGSDRIFPPHSAPPGINAESLNVQRALAEVDGLDAGLQHLDRKEPSDWASFALQSLPGQCDLQLEAGPSTWNTPLVHPDVSARTSATREASLSSIRDIRRRTDTLWQKLRGISIDLRQPAIHSIIKEYASPQGFRDAGIFALKNVLRGSAPNNLKTMFAFASISDGILSFLEYSNRLTKQDILENLLYWTYAFLSYEESRQFQRLAFHLWPESNTQLYLIDNDVPWNPLTATDATPSNRAAPRFPEYTLNQAPASEGFSYQNDAPPMLNQFLQSDRTNNVHIPASNRLAKFVGDLCEYSFLYFRWYQFQQVDSIDPALTLNAYEQNFGYAGLSYTPSQRLAVTESRRGSGQNSSFLTPAISTQTQSRPATTTPSLSWEDKLFRARDAFLESHEAPSYEPSNDRDLEQRMDARDEIRWKYLGPLKRHLKDAPSIRLLSTTRELIDLGRLETIESVKEYLATVGKVSQEPEVHLVLTNSLQIGIHGGKHLPRVW